MNRPGACAPSQVVLVWHPCCQGSPSMPRSPTACVTGENNAVFSTAATAYRCLNGDDHDIVKKGTGGKSIYCCTFNDENFK